LVTPVHEDNTVPQMTEIVEDAVDQFMLDLSQEFVQKPVYHPAFVCKVCDKDVFLDHMTPPFSSGYVLHHILWKCNIHPRNPPVFGKSLGIVFIPPRRYPQ
jgi:hypothetical protein